MERNTWLIVVAMVPIRGISALTARYGPQAITKNRRASRRPANCAISADRKIVREPVVAEFRGSITFVDAPTSG